LMNSHSLSVSSPRIGNGKHAPGKIEADPDVFLF
jgi:hypothetical protein